MDAFALAGLIRCHAQKLAPIGADPAICIERQADHELQRLSLGQARPVLGSWHRTPAVFPPVLILSAAPPCPTRARLLPTRETQGLHCAQARCTKQPLNRQRALITRNSQGDRPTTLPRATPATITSQGQQRGHGQKLFSGRSGRSKPSCSVSGVGLAAAGMAELSGFIVPYWQPARSMDSDEFW